MNIIPDSDDRSAEKLQAHKRPDDFIQIGRSISESGQDKQAHTPGILRQSYFSNITFPAYSEINTPGKSFNHPDERSEIVEVPPCYEIPVATTPLHGHHFVAVLNENRDLKAAQSQLDSYSHEQTQEIIIHNEESPRPEDINSSRAYASASYRKVLSADSIHDDGLVRAKALNETDVPKDGNELHHSNDTNVHQVRIFNLGESHCTPEKLRQQPQHSKIGEDMVTLDDTGGCIVDKCVDENISDRFDYCAYSNNTQERVIQDNQRNREEPLETSNIMSEEEIHFNELVNSVSKDMKEVKRSFTNTGGYKITDTYWTDIENLDGPVPHGHSGAAVFRFELSCKKRLPDIKEANDGYMWKKQALVKKDFESCSDHVRYVTN